MIKIYKYLKPHWKSALLAPILMAIEVIADLQQPALLATIVDQGVKEGNIPLIIKTGAVMIGIAFIGLLGGLGCTAFSSIASMSLGTDLRANVYQKVQSFSFGNLDKFKTSSLITRLTNDIVQVQNVVLMSLRILVRAPLLFIGGIVMAVRINPKLTGIFVCAIPILILSLFFVIKRGFPLFTKVQQRLDKVNNVMRENLTGIRVVKAFVRSDFEKSRFGSANDDLVEVTVAASRLMVVIMPLMLLIMNLSIVAVIWFGGIQVTRGSMAVGQIIAFINYMNLILFSLIMVAFVLMSFSRAKVSADRINEVLDTEMEIKDEPHASDEPIQRGRILFDHVSFKYPGAGGEPVLKNISFTANPGETVAILGGIGSGKSTLVSLLPRLYDVTEGMVSVDGRDVRSIKLTTLRRSISFVLQESILFSGTIKDNIRWGKKDASDDEVIEAAKAAQAHEFIMAFNEGYETILGQRGVNISGGQKQRISIARALINKAPILILDDSTSAVDMGTEYRIQKNLKEMMKNTTCIVIAQRISTVLEADKILVLEQGEITDQGTHEELLKTSPIYQDIYRSQMGKEGLENVQ